MSVVLAGENGGIVLLTEPFSGGGGGVTSVTGSGNIASSGGATPNITFTGTLPVANGGTGVTASSGASSVVLRDANGNITTNAAFEGFTSVAASGTPITLTAASTPVYNVTGSGGQVIQLPNATTLPNGTIFSFNNNQSSGAITVNNASSTLVVSVPSGGYVTVTLLSNAISAGSWDRHDQTPSNVSWSTNTFDYPGSITSATWNGTAVAVNRGGTGQTTTTAAINALLPTQATNSGKYLTTDGTNTSWATVSGGGSPGGSTTQVQFNNAGAFGGSANFTWDGTNAQLGATGALRFADSDSSNYVAFKAPSVIGANVNWTLPATDGTVGQVLVTNGSGILSWATVTITPTSPTNNTLPVVTGTPTVGETLSSTSGTWNGYPAPTFAYQWVRGAATNISGATSSSYQLQDADLATTVKCTVTATNIAGSASATSAATSTIAAGPPQAPTGVTAVAGNTQATVSFTAPAITGGSTITGYTVTSNPGGFTATGSASPLTVTGLTNGTSYTFTVTATNAIGTGPASTASNSVTPTAAPVAPSSVEYLVVGGGGGGAGELSTNAGGGGGGAGGYRTNAAFSVSGGTPYPVTVGNFGSGGAAGQNNGAVGSASVFSSISSAGGGYGSSRTTGGNGGSGGGGGLNLARGLGNIPSTSPPQGNDGGGLTGGTSAAAGGGGATDPGQNSQTNTQAGNGGAGTTSSIAGSSTPTVYAGGGGGGGLTGGTGGTGGGGNGAQGNAAGNPGTTNTGGGGGGAYDQSTSGKAGGNGGSGVVIIAYPDTFANLSSIDSGLTTQSWNGSAWVNNASGSTTPNTTIRSGYKVYRFSSGTGSIQW
jgi:hypothetical protein